MSNLLFPAFVKSNSLRWLTKMRDSEQIAKVAHQKWANERIAHIFEKRDLFRKPMSEFPTLYMYIVHFVFMKKKYWRIAYILRTYEKSNCIYRSMPSTVTMYCTALSVNLYVGWSEWLVTPSIYPHVTWYRLTCL